MSDSLPPAAADAPAVRPGATLRAKLGEVLALDVRSLAVFRIGLAVVLLGDLLIRATDLEAHYTDAGILPRDAVHGSGFTSLHLLGGSAAFEGLLFAVAALCAVALLVGYRTWPATLASWLLLVSLHARNPLILQGGDIVLRMLLFWGLFLPLGACWSLDARGRPAPAPRVCSVATAALMLQVCFVYWFSAALKTDPAWRSEGTAVYYALSLDQLATPLGKSLLAYPDFLRVLTFATLAFEAFGPLLLFCPVWNGAARLVAVVGFILFHAGLGLCLELGPFPYVCSVAWLAFLPTGFWERIRARLRSPAAAPESLSGVPAAFALLCLLYVLLWNLWTIGPGHYDPRAPQKGGLLGFATPLEQFWGMFSPSPPKDDGWYVAVGTLRDGTTVDLPTGGPVSWDKPRLVSATYKNERWRKYMMEFRYDDRAPYRERYADYLWRRWDADHDGPSRLTSVEIYFMRQQTRLDREPSAPQRVLLCRVPPADPRP